MLTFVTPLSCFTTDLILAIHGGKMKSWENEKLEGWNQHTLFTLLNALSNKRPP